MAKTGKKSPDKPKEKPDKFCMDIKATDKILLKNTVQIKEYVSKLYQKKEFKDNKMEEDEINVIIDTKGKRVCISPARKTNALYLKMENIHKKITPAMLKMNDNITLSEPLADVLKHHLEVKEKIKVPEGLKWVTLSHNGPYFKSIMEPYEPHKVPILYDKKPYVLTPAEEEVAGFYAKRLITDETAAITHTSKPLFNKNFWKDFKTYLTPEHKKIFTDFSKFDFSRIIKKLKEIKESETEKSKKEKKIKSEEKKAEYGYAIVNGVKEKIGGFVVEPAAIFLGRGENKITGSIKRDVMPEDVTVNVGKKDKVPEPPAGHKWKEVVHDQKAQWISKWNDTLTNDVKYIYLSAEGQFKSESDAQKFEKSRKLNKYIDSVRKGYKKYVDSSDMEKRQLGTVVYLVDNYGIRIGGPNDDSTADTFGASTLLVEHIKLKSPDKATFEFLGKDSILYKQTMTLPPRIFKNLEDFVKGKKKADMIFDRIGACDINNFLKTFDKDISAKVFRTRLGSSIMYKGLEEIDEKSLSSEVLKRKSFENANILVANALNHQRTIPKSAEKGIQKLQDEIKELEKEAKTKKGKEKATVEIKLEKKRLALDSKNNLKSIAISTSRTNYIDPRLIVAWCKKNNLDINKVYTPVLQRKFKWAIDTTDGDWDYMKSPMLSGFETLQPKKDVDECKKEEPVKKKKVVKEPAKKKEVKQIPESESDDSDTPLVKNKQKKGLKDPVKKKEVKQIPESSESGDSDAPLVKNKQAKSAKEPAKKKKQVSFIKEDSNIEKGDVEEKTMLAKMVDTWIENINDDKYLNDILKIYNYNILGEASNFVKKIWKDKENRNKIRDSLRLIIAPDVSHLDIATHLGLRNPIQINGARYEDIDIKNMKKTLGYDDEDVKNKNLDPKIRYGILGWTPLAPNSIAKDLWFLHTWGVNLESLKTTDAKYIFEDGKFNKDRYVELMNIMFDIVFTSAKKLHSMTKKTVVLRMSGLGMGAWSKKMPKGHKKEIMELYTKKLASFSESWLQVRHPIHPDMETKTFRDGNWVTVENNHDPFGDYPNRKKTTIIEPYPKDSVTLIVNAWDDGSFIGNGGSEDNTMDGWTVAGGSNEFDNVELKGLSSDMPSMKGVTMGKHAQNASFLHNIFFSPKLFIDSDEWIVAKPYDGGTVSFILSWYKETLKLLGYSFLVNTEGNYYLTRTDKKLSKVMLLSKTHDDILDLVSLLKDNNMLKLALLLLAAVCEDVKENFSIKNLPNTQKFFEKYRNFISKLKI